MVVSLRQGQRAQRQRQQQKQGPHQEGYHRVERTHQSVEQEAIASTNTNPHHRKRCQAVPHQGEQDPGQELPEEKENIRTAARQVGRPNKLLGTTTVHHRNVQFECRNYESNATGG